jgi:hypothetical protein
MEKILFEGEGGGDLGGGEANIVSTPMRERERDGEGQGEKTDTARAAWILLLGPRGDKKGRQGPDIQAQGFLRDVLLSRGLVWNCEGARVVS